MVMVSYSLRPLCSRTDFSHVSRSLAGSGEFFFTAASPPPLGFEPKANWRTVFSSLRSVLWREKCTVIVVVVAGRRRLVTVGRSEGGIGGASERVICKNPFLSSAPSLYPSRLPLSFAPFFIVGHIMQLQLSPV